MERAKAKELGPNQLKKAYHCCNANYRQMRMNTWFSSTYGRIALVCLAYLLLAGFTLFTFDGTGDAGDSILHFLIARWAPTHTWAYFDHWGKPFFTFLASPFAQLGFTGIKLFNVLAMTATGLLSMLTAKHLHFRWPFLAGVFLMGMPKVFALTFSGLTEPLFALLLIASVYLLLLEKGYGAAFLLSFLPFVRSEGLLIIGVFVLYFLWKRKWRALPLLAAGHVIYGLLGYALLFESPLWVLNRIPYAKLNSTYGEGYLFRFVEGLLHITGVPLYILFWIGTLWSIWELFAKKVSAEWFFLVFFAFWTFLIAHSLFWYLGIFNSMGLLRVLVGVSPLVALLALRAWEAMAQGFMRSYALIGKSLQGISLLLILLFPFTGNIYALWPQRDLSLTPQQRLAKAFVQQLKQEVPKGGDIKLPRIVNRDPYLSLLLEVDHLDYGVRMNLNERRLKELKAGDWVLWDSWFAVVEEGITEAQLDARDDLEKRHRQDTIRDGRPIIYKLYERKDLE